MRRCNKVIEVQNNDVTVQRANVMGSMKLPNTKPSAKNSPSLTQCFVVLLVRNLLQQKSNVYLYVRTICAESELDGVSGYYNHVSVEEYVLASRESVMCRRPRKLSMESDGWPCSLDYIYICFLF